MFKKKTMLFLTGLLLILVGCIGGNETDTGYGVKLERNNGSLSVVSDQKSLATEFKINAKITEDQIKSNKIYIINTGEEETIITVLDSELGESLVEINGVKEGVTAKKVKSVTQEDFDSEISSSNKAIKRATSDPKLLGDFNSDNIVDLTDLSMFADIYNKAYDVSYDIFPATKGTGDWLDIYAYTEVDSVVDIYDFIIFGRNFNKQAPQPDPVLESITITGPSEVDEGNTITLVGTANYSDNTTTTAGISWISDNENVATVVNGEVTGVMDGSVNITASKEGITKNYAITVNPVVTDADFTWDNALMYFVIPDRFYNGDTANDNSYGRKNDGLPSVGTFHGGDIAGLTQKLDYLDNLGINSIWITSPYEQIHGYVSGGDSGDFPHYAYHGYYPLDYTMMDKNMGTVEEFRTFVNEAHERGIRVVMDIVMNHAGYNTLVDAAEYGFGEVNMDPTTAKDFVLDDATDGTFYDFHSEFSYSGDWSGWWGANWVRAGKDDIYQNALGNLGTDTQDEINGNLANLPDFKTNEQGNVGMAPILSTKWAMEDSSYDDWIVPAAKNLRNDIGLSPAVYIEEWLAAWVEEFGIDGFRVDTAKHVEMPRWGELKGKAQSALDTWRANNPTAPGADWDEDFWMTGEHYDWTISGGDKSYFNDNNGDGIQDFDSMINFGFSQDPSQWGSYASDLNNSNINALHYISSHDTQLGAIGNKISAGTSLILAPGGSQIFYGDETDRPLGPAGSDPDQGTRSSMNWGENPEVLSHWQKLGQFRRNNPAVGAGSQTDLGNNTYGRVWNTNKVVIKVGSNGSTSVNVSGIFADGTNVRNAYNGETGTVSSSSVTFTGENGVILIEEVK
ncbi:MAG: alpha-amylase family glycosyl hydrolase [Fusobacteriota bacterium]